ncbi:hypothetical protein [Paenibacillus glucanolyticus]|uniref:hypothetical protein n=1 Tax=Paenibacillus glucanolyticus TaxID=59843 RepID=UPI00096E1C81|nr:hypothetical protein [Paenibacillus glucanolyticus]OMF76698.1 hypothetical protein BK142_14345 [Paenibacillus glucanolyticus]
MKEKEILFEVRYVGQNTYHFTYGNVYPVYGLDPDGDYEVLNDFKDIMVDYKSNFKKVKE